MNRKAAVMLEAFDVLTAGAVIVEIGCARFAHEIPSDGWSTVYLAGAAENRDWVVHSVDINPDAVTIASAATSGLPITIHEADGREWLTSFTRTINGLYLDGALDPEQALGQYEAARLASDAVVVIDDVQHSDIGGIDLEHGKGNLLLERLQHDGFDVTVLATEPGYAMAVARARG
jgi:predicted O-methyltransferase YrrM